jgi:hypothetical protein
LGDFGLMRAGRVDEAEQSRGMLGEVQVRATKQPRLDVARLGATIDEASCFEVIETAIERSHGLQRPAREQFPARENGSERFGCVDSAGESRKHRASARRELFNVCGSERSPEDNPGQVG